LIKWSHDLDLELAQVDAASIDLAWVDSVLTRPSGDVFRFP
jgi:hypothetical protein